MQLPLRFVRAVLNYWGTLLTSGLLIGALEWWQSTGHEIPRTVYWIFGLVAFVVAAYRPWRDEYQRADELQTRVDAHKRWEFHADFLGASRTVYTYENGTSPSVSLFIRARVDNRNVQPTTVYARSVSVKLKSGVIGGFERATIAPGGSFNLDYPEDHDQYDVPGTGSMDLLFYTRRFNPPHIEEWVDRAPLPVTITLAETFGNRCELSGDLMLGSVEKQ
jgi:hypothetical protein